MSDLEAYRAEQQRQTEILAKAINKAITETAVQFETPMMNAVAGALVAVQGHMLASVPAKHRKEMKASMLKKLPVAIAQAKGQARIAETIVLGGKSN